MGTRSTIGYETADGGYVGVYAHYDGYPSHMGPALHAMLHADVVIMVNRALAGGGIRSIFEPDSEGRPGGYEVFNDGPRDPDTEWPCLLEEYAYRKRWDGRVEFIDGSNSVYEWLPEIGYQD